MFLANAIPLENKRRLLHVYLLKLPFKKACMSKCLSVNPAFLGLRTFFPKGRHVVVFYAMQMRAKNVF